MIEKLQNIKKRFDEIETLLANPQTVSNLKYYTELCKEHKDLEEVVTYYNKYTSTVDNLDQTKDLLYTEKDPDFRKMIKSEIDYLTQQQQEIESQLKELLTPRDPKDKKNVILEIRSGTGGDEAALFAGDLLRMYQRFAEKKGWKFIVIDLLEGPSGGYKEIISTISGENVYGTMKYESGVHRVQRIPTTETQGRIHTSAASVVVLPEMDELDIKINPNDIRKDTFCSSGPGGQSVNTTYSAVRLTHIPTGIVVSCQDEKSQIKNYEKALKVLLSRIYEIEMKKQETSISSERKSIIKNNDRSDKIRTYNYPQGRITDHRIGHTIHNLPAFMDGDIYPMIEALSIADNAERLQNE